MDFDQPSPTATLSPPGSPVATTHHVPDTTRPGGAPQPTKPVTHHPAGATVYAPTMTPSAELNPRSCMTCRRRKVRCDKSMPCSNCRRAHIPCIFPAPERAPRRPRRKDPAALTKPQAQSSDREIELMKRLRKLEGIVEDLSGQVEMETIRNRPERTDSPTGTGSKGEGAHGETGSASGGSRTMYVSPTASDSATPPAGQGATGQTQGKGRTQEEDISNRFGRLMLSDRGKTRYVSSAFWSKLNDELADLRAETQRISGSSDDESEDEASPATDAKDSPGAVDHHGFIMGYRSCDLDLSGLHPQPTQTAYLWEHFVENVDPLVKILHKPTVAKHVWESRSGQGPLTPATEALLFAIYFSAVTSLEDEDIQEVFGTKKMVLVGQYRFALEQSLAKAELLTTSDMMVLQALVIFLTAARRHDDTRFCWTMTALAVRTAESMGLHRDGSRFPNLSLFECEMRRRLWHVLSLLDLRSAEEQGTDLIILERSHDTRYPVNCNDEDMTPNMTELPPARTGPSDMTVSTVRYEILELSRRIYASTSARASDCPNALSPNLEERENLIQSTWRRIQSTYLSDPAMEGIPRYWVVGNICRVIIAKMTLLIYQHVLLPGHGSGNLPQNLRDRLFATATEIFEYAAILTTDPRAKRWRWLFKTYTQWHAVAYLLVEVSMRSWTASVERAWSALMPLFADDRAEGLQRLATNTEIWVPFKKLVARAKKHRKLELERLTADHATAAKLDEEDQARYAPLNFESMSLSLKGIATRERWRKLVGLPPLPPLPPPTWKNPPVPEPQIAQSTAPVRAVTTAAPSVPGYEKPLSDTLSDILTDTNRFFTPTDLFPVAFNPGVLDVYNPSAPNPSAAAPMGVSGLDLLRSGMHAGTVARNNGSPLASVTSAPLDGASTVGGPGLVSDTPLVDSMRDHAPPWMWPQIDGVGGLAGSGFFQSPQLSDNSGFEEVDVNMDENFDWQGFGENLKGFDMDLTGQGAAWNGRAM